MLSSNQIRADIEGGKALRLMSEVYTDLAASRLLKIRSRIEANRLFVAELASLYSAVKEAAGRQKLRFPSKPKALATILITSNHPFYGTIENRVIQFFLARSLLERGDVFVVGRNGQAYFSQSGRTPSFQSVNFLADLPNHAELFSLSQNMSSYERVIVYYPRFQTVFLQEPTVIDISGLVNPSPPLAKTPYFSQKSFAYSQKSFAYIFEPELPQMQKFFDTQIMHLLLEQAFLEADLARTSARLVLMSDSQARADQFIAEHQRLLSLARQAEKNARVIEMTLGVLARKKDDRDD